MELNELETKLNEYVDKIKNTKSFKTNKKIQDEYKIIWNEYAEKTVFSEKAMLYYYDCFKIDLSVTLYNYLNNNEISPETFRKFLCLKFDTYHPHYPMCLNLFAHFINNNFQKYKYYEKLITFLPHNFKNREGNVNGNAVKDFEKYFLSIIKKNPTLPDINKLDLNKMQLNKFGNMFVYCLESIIKNSKNSYDKETIDALLIWSKSLITNFEVQENNTIIKEKSETTEEKLENALLFIKKQKETIKSLNETINHQTERLSIEANEKVKLSNELRNAHNINTNLSFDKHNLQKRIEELEKQINILQDEINSEKKLNKNVAGNNQKQLDAFFYKLSENLKFEYEDFKDALDADMSVSLGENMRTQLGNIFKILSDSGIKLE